MYAVDHTHDVQLRSWVESANQADSLFPIQNLPVCTFVSGDGSPGLGVGIGDQIVDLRAVHKAGCFAASSVPATSSTVAAALESHDLKCLMALSKPDRIALRHAMSCLLRQDCAALRDNSVRSSALVPRNAAVFRLPTTIGDYTDFYASVFHATNVGSMFRPDNPLLPNYKWVPIGYHGRSSSIGISGQQVCRPVGQVTPEEGQAPAVKPCVMLDYELEVGIFVAVGNELSQRVRINDAEEYLFGLSILNDWSARDLQKWEYQPLGPFLAKSFASTISPWIVTMEALAPFRCSAMIRPEGDPQPLPYLDSPYNRESGGIDVRLEVHLATAQMRQQGHAPQRLSSGSFQDLYWTPAQMLTHHTSNGCNLQPGDLLGSGTVSGRARESRGCLMELTWDGELGNPVPGSQRTPIKLPTGEERKFLADGDEVIINGYCEADGFRRIGLGECRGTIVAARERS